MKVRRFEDLKVWKLARIFRQEIYKVGKSFSNEERYHLTAQIRDAAVSITANIAEGFGRYHFQENIQSCRIARGSINEVLDQLYSALDAHYVSKNNLKNFMIRAGRSREP